MANSTPTRSLSLDDSLAAPALMFRLPLSAAQLSGAEFGLAVRLSDLDWVEFEDRGSESWVVLSGLGQEARSDMLCAAAEALADYARRVPVG